MNMEFDFYDFDCYFRIWLNAKIRKCLYAHMCISLNKENSDEKVLKSGTSELNFENIGWNEGSTMYFYANINGYEAGRECVPWGTPIEPITHYVRKKKVEIFMISLYNMDEIEETDLGEINTVDQAKMSVADYNNQTYLLYSKYGGDHSNIMGIPIELETHIEQMDVYDFSSWDGTFPNATLTTGTEETNSDTRTLLAKLNLSPYTQDVRGWMLDDSETDFRFLYTQREYNSETGNYYYRARIMDSTTGRFTSKDPILYLNLYRYVKNNPNYFVDSLGLDPDDWFDFSNFGDMWWDNFSLTLDLTMNPTGNPAFDYGIDTLGSGGIGLGLAAVSVPWWWSLVIAGSYVGGVGIGSFGVAAFKCTHWDEIGKDMTTIGDWATGSNIGGPIPLSPNFRTNPNAVRMAY